MPCRHLRSALYIAVAVLVLGGLTSCMVAKGGGGGSEAKGMVGGEVDGVLAATEQAFLDLGITRVDAGSTADLGLFGAGGGTFATIIGTASTGSRVVVSIHRKGDRQCEVTVSTDGPTDPALGSSVLQSINGQKM